ncbi:hypothetical protein Mapa_008395 [Marchantia paleacea]|nr:hypothetical protein Mapa_008395 [Marchantia paleacea]
MLLPIPHWKKCRSSKNCFSIILLILFLGVRSNVILDLAQGFDLPHESSPYQHPPVNVQNEQADQQRVADVVLERTVRLTSVRHRQHFIAGAPDYPERQNDQPQNDPRDCKNDESHCRYELRAAVLRQLGHLQEDVARIVKGQHHGTHAAKPHPVGHNNERERHNMM